MVRYALLGLLREQRDYGYRLKMRFDERVGTAWHLNIGQVYQTLRALQRAKLVAEVGDAPGEIAPCSDGAHPARRMFELTAKGERALERWLARPPVRMRPVREEMLIRLLVSAPERRAELLARLAEQEHQYRRHQTRLLAQQRKEASEAASGGVVRNLSLEASLLHTEAHLKWLAFCREQLNDSPVVIEQQHVSEFAATPPEVFDLPVAASA